MEKEDLTTETAAQFSGFKDGGFSSNAGSLKDLRSEGRGESVR